MPLGIRAIFLTLFALLVLLLFEEFSQDDGAVGDLLTEVRDALDS